MERASAVTDSEADGGCGKHSSIPKLVEAIKSESLVTTYVALKWLYRKAADEDAARAIKFADGYRWIVHCGGSANGTWGRWAYAYGCLERMFTCGVITEEVRDGLSVHDATADELDELLELLKSPARGQDERVIEALEQIRYIQNWPEDTRVSFAIAIVDLLHRVSVAVLEEGTLTLQSLLLTDENVALEAIKHGIIPLLLNQVEVGSDRQQDLSATTLVDLSRHDSIAVPAQVVVCLTSRLRRGDERQTLLAARCLASIARKEDTRFLLVEQRVCGSLVELLRRGSEKEKVAAADALYWCLFDEAACVLAADAGVIQLVLDLLQADSLETKQTASWILRELPKHSEACANEIISAGGAGKLVASLRLCDDETLQQNAMITLGYLACSRENQQSIAEAGAIGPVVECLGSSADTVQRCACTALSSLSQDNEAISRTIVAAGALGPLVALVRETSNSNCINAVEVLDILSQVESLVPDISATKTLSVLARVDIVDAGAIPRLIDLAATGIDPLHRQLAADALQSLTVFNESQEQSHDVVGPKSENFRTITVPQVNGSHVDVLHSVHKAGECAANESCRQVVLCGEQSSIPELIEALRSESLETTYSALKWLFRKADEEEGAATAITNADGYRLILHCAGVPTATWDHWAYAFGCLVQMHVCSAITLDMLVGLPTRVPTKDKLEQLIEILKSSSPDSEERAIEALEKACFVLHWPEDTKLPLTIAVVDLLRRASIRQLRVTTKTIRFLVTDDKDVALAASTHGVVSLLLNQLDIGSDDQQQLSVAALSRLAAYDSRAATPRLIDMFATVLRSQDESHKADAVNYLESITENVATHHILVQHRIYESLVELVRIGSEGPRGDRPLATTSVELLGRLASSDDATSALIAKAGGVAAIAPLVQTGTHEQKKHAAHVLYSLARRDTKIRAELMKLKVVAPLVKMTRDGDDEQKTNAALALGSLMKTPAARLQVMKLGGIDALKTLAEKGSPSQVEAARRAVRISTNVAFESNGLIAAEYYLVLDI